MWFKKSTNKLYRWRQKEDAVCFPSMERSWVEGREASHYLVYKVHIPPIAVLTRSFYLPHMLSSFKMFFLKETWSATDIWVIEFFNYWLNNTIKYQLCVRLHSKLWGMQEWFIMQLISTWSHAFGSTKWMDVHTGKIQCDEDMSKIYSITKGIASHISIQDLRSKQREC